MSTRSRTFRGIFVCYRTVPVCQSLFGSQHGYALTLSTIALGR